MPSESLQRKHGPANLGFGIQPWKCERMHAHCLQIPSLGHLIRKSQLPQVTKNFREFLNIQHGREYHDPSSLCRAPVSFCAAHTAGLSMFKGLTLSHCHWNCVKQDRKERSSLQKGHWFIEVCQVGPQFAHLRNGNVNKQQPEGHLRVQVK